jgi:ribonucleoside-triphosphate reductase
MIEFITKKNIQEAEKEYGIPKFGPLGDIIDTRTYRRFLPKDKRRETFYERNARTVNYNISLANEMQSAEELQEEADLLYSQLNQLKVWPSGRTQWVGGTKCTELNPHANYNCSFTAINRPSAFGDGAELLMLGCGFGFRVHSKDINQLPDVNYKPKVQFEPYFSLPKNQRLEENQIKTQGKAILIEVGDSRESWVSTIQLLIDSYFGLYEDIEEISFNFNSVRPIGERIKGFGGTASGPEALQGILHDIVEIFEELPSNRLRSIDCMDIICACARGIIAGSSRRSALICLFEEGDLLCRNSKLGLYTNPALAKKSYRSQSNNTENIGSGYEKEVKAFLFKNPDLSIQHPKVKSFLASLAPSKETLTKMFESVKTEGEPGFDNWPRMQMLRFYAAKQHRPQFTSEEIWERYCDVGTNPCHEILLNTGVKDSYQVSFCNLTSVPLINHLVFKDDVFTVDNKSLELAIRLATRIGLRQTCVEMPSPHLSETQKEERLLGVSFTGLRDIMDALNWQTNGDEIKNLLRQMKEWAEQEASIYAEKLNVPRPLLVTTLKPEGTFSKVVGASNGLHFDWAPFYIQRVRMSGADALAKTLVEQGFPAIPEVYDLEKIYPEIESVWGRIDAFLAETPENKLKLLRKANTVVFEFPIKSISKTSQGDASVKEQLQNIDNVTKYYVSHMASNTVTVTNDDWDVCVDWIADNWADYTTASFLPYFAGGDYPLLPFESISEEEYATRVAAIPEESRQLDDKNRYFYTVNLGLLQKFEIEIEDPDDVDVDQVAGSCGLADKSCPTR